MNAQLSFVSPEAKIGKNVKIEPFAVIYEDVEIGDDCQIGPHVTIYPGARIGKGCKIFPGASIAAIPQDLKFAGEYTTCEIGDNNIIIFSTIAATAAGTIPEPPKISWI